MLKAFSPSFEICFSSYISLLPHILLLSTYLSSVCPELFWGELLCGLCWLGAPPAPEICTLKALGWALSI